MVHLQSISFAYIASGVTEPTLTEPEAAVRVPPHVATVGVLRVSEGGGGGLGRSGDGGWQYASTVE
jgi:hypothetical protein